MPVRPRLRRTPSNLTIAGTIKATTFLINPAIMVPFFSFFTLPNGAELLIIFFVILLLFGAKKLPELAKGMGKSIKEFKKAATELEDDFREAMDAADPEKPVAQPASKTAARPSESPAAESHQPEPASAEKN